MKKMRMFAATLVATVAFALAACGGGGGGGESPAPTPSADTTPPVLTPGPASTFPSSISVMSNEPLGGNVSVTVTNGNGATLSGSTSLNADNLGMTWRPSETVKCGTYQVNASGTDLAGNTGTTKFTVAMTDCQNTSSWWPPTTIYPIGQKVVGANVLTGTNVQIGDATWQTAVKNGTVKFVDTGMVLTGFDQRPIVWAVHQYNNSWCTIAVHKDDGSPVGNWTSAGATCKTDPADYFIGSQAGLIRHITNRNQCIEIRWDQAAANIFDAQVPCP